MKKKMYQNVVATHFRDHSSIYLFVVVLFLMGVIFGAIVVNSLSFNQKEDLFHYLSMFFGEMSKGEIASSKELFLQSFFHNSKYIGIMWVLGISIIGLPVILILLFLKGIVVGFTVGFLVSQMGWKGFLLSLGTVLPQNLIIIPVFIYVTTMSVSFSFIMIRKQFMKKTGEPIWPQFTKYFLSLIGALVLLIVAAAIEAYVSPVILNLIGKNLN